MTRRLLLVNALRIFEAFQVPPYIASPYPEHRHTCLCDQNDACHLCDQA